VGANPLQLAADAASGAGLAKSLAPNEFRNITGKRAQ
jgi:hypothetical protein